MLSVKDSLTVTNAFDVTTEEGDDSLTFDASVQAGSLSIAMGEGANTLGVTRDLTVTAAASVTAGSGVDTVTFNGTHQVGSLSLALGAGNNVLSVKNSLTVTDAFGVTTEEGDDRFTFDASIQAGSLSLAMGEGANTLGVTRDLTVTAAASVTAGSGVDTVTFNGTHQADSLSLSLGAGDNVLSVKDNLTVTNAFDVETTGGDDRITFDASIQAGSLSIAMGDGANTLDVTRDLTVDGLAEVTAGSGVDSVTFNGTHQADSLSLALGAGNNVLSVNNSLGVTNAFDVTTREGDDRITFDASIQAGSLSIAMGEGANTLGVIKDLTVTTAAKVTSGAGTDTVTFNGDHRADTLSVDSGDGDDLVSFLGQWQFADSLTVVTRAGDDRLLFDGRHRAGSIAVDLGDDNDILHVHGDIAVTDDMGFRGGSGNDDMLIHADTLVGAMLVAGDGGKDRLTVVELNDRQALLTLDGGSGSDEHRIVTRQADQGDYRIRVLDSGASNAGADTLFIEGRGYDNYDGSMVRAQTTASNTGDLFLVRDNFVARLAEAGSAVERIDVGGSINARVTINGHDGADRFVVDGSSTVMTLDGGRGDDRFEIGQQYGEHPNPVGTASAGVYASGVVVGDEIAVTQAGDGFVSRGNGQAMSVLGGEGNDQYQVYATQAPLALDGEDGYDSLSAFGSSADDNFVITAGAVFGAGLNLSHDDLERVRVEAGAGDDRIQVLSTRESVLTEVIGGLGSDQIQVAGDVSGEVKAIDARGASSLVGHGTVSADEAYANLLAEALTVQVASPEHGAILVEQPGGATRVVEGGDAAAYWLSTNLPISGIAEGSRVTLTLSASMASTQDRHAAGAASAETLLLSLDALGEFTQAITVDFVFTGGSWSPRQQIFVKAPTDGLAEGTRQVAISYLAQVETPSSSPLPQALASLLDQPIADTEITVFDATRGDVVVSTAQDRLQVIEGEGASAQSGSLEVRLSVAPQAGEVITVSVDLSAFGGRLVAKHGATLSFDASNWDKPQTLVLEALGNTDIEDRIDAQLGFDISSNLGQASSFAERASSKVDVSVHDDDSAGLVVEQSDGGTRVSTLGGSDSYTLRLTKAPSAEVRVHLNSDGQTEFPLGGRIVLDTLFDGERSVTVLAAQGAGAILVLEDGDWASLGAQTGRYLSLEDGSGSSIAGRLRINHIDAQGRLHLMSDDTLASWVGDSLTLTSVTTPAVVFDASNWADKVAVEVVAETRYRAPVEAGMQFVTERRLSDIQGPLIVEGGTGADTPVPSVPLMLPSEGVSALAAETSGTAHEDSDSLVLHVDASVADLSGVIGAERVSGLGMGEGVLSQDNGVGGTIDTERGVHFHGVEVFEALMGAGDDQLAIDADSVAYDGDWQAQTVAGVSQLNRSAGSWYADGFRAGDSVLVGEQRLLIRDITSAGALVLDGVVSASSGRVIREMPLSVVHGGGGDDHIRVSGGYQWQMPLVVFGDTSRSGERYSAVGGRPTLLAQPFLEAGDNLLDASQAIGGVVLVGGAGADTLIGGLGDDQLFGGSGDDRLSDEKGGNNHLYGDGGIDVDVSRRLSQADTVMTVHASAAAIAHPTGDSLIAGDDMLSTGGGDDILLGDHGVIQLEARPGEAGLRLLDSQRVIAVEGVDMASGGDDSLSVSGGDNLLIGGSGNDVLSGGGASDWLIGDNAKVTLKVVNDLSSGATLVLKDSIHDGGDRLFGGEGNDLLLGGGGSDVLYGGSSTSGGRSGDDLLVGDYARLDVVGTQVRELATLPSANGAADRLDGGDGRNVLIGGEGSDSLSTGGNDSVTVASPERSASVAIGDHGLLEWNAAGVLVNATSRLASDTAASETSAMLNTRGGDDSIRLSGGHSVVIGGVGSDLIEIVKAGDGARHVVLADRGTLSWSDVGVLVNGDSLTPNVGGADRVAVESGSVTALGGAGADTIEISAASVDARHLLFGDNGSLRQSASGVLLSAASSATAIGGDDTLEVNAGSVTAIGGAGDDRLSITAASATSRHQLIGDNGRLQWDDTSVLRTMTSTASAVAGQDRIGVNAGRNEIVGGAGSDVIITGDQTSTVLADLGRLEWNAAGHLVSVRSLAHGHGAPDSVSVGSGGNLVIGAEGDDVITSAAGADKVAGDHAEVLFDANGVVTSFASLHFAIGGVDTITTGKGDDWIIGGFGGERISALGGDNVVIGDNGSITAQDGVRQEVKSLDRRQGTGGGDVILLGVGRDQAIGGVGADTLVNAGGETVAIADDGRILSDTTGRYRLAETGNIALRSDNHLIGGIDRDVLLGGGGKDTLEGGAGNDILMGDFARVTRVPGLITIETIDNFEGSDDVILTGLGHDVAMGGAGFDGFGGDYGFDILIGEYGRVRLSVASAGSTSVPEVERVTSIVTLAQGKLDLVRGAQQNLYREQEPGGRLAAWSWMDRTEFALGEAMVSNNRPAAVAPSQGLEDLRGVVAGWAAHHDSRGGMISGLPLFAAPPAAGSVPTAPDAAEGSESLEAVPSVDDATLDQSPQAAGSPASTEVSPKVSSEADASVPAEQQGAMGSSALGGLAAALAGAGWGVARALTSSTDHTDRLKTLRREQAAEQWRRLRKDDDEETS